jgi:hypothetical protein
MKIPNNVLAVLLALLFFNGACLFDPGIDKGKFEKLKVAVQAVKTSIATGESYEQVTGRVQQLATDIAALKDNVRTPKEKELLDAYSVLLANYQDGLVLWKYKLDFAFFDFVLKGRIYVGQDVEPIVIKYRFPTESHLYEPTGQYWKSIPGDSIEIIWSCADSQLKNIEGIATY